MNSTGESDQLHPLATINADATVRRLLDETRRRILEQEHENNRQQGDQAQSPDDPPRPQTPSPGPPAHPEPLGPAEARQEARPGWIPLLAPDGTAFTIPIELSTIITQLQREMGVVKEKLNSLMVEQYPPTCSTRIAHEGGDQRQQVGYNVPRANDTLNSEATPFVPRYRPSRPQSAGPQESEWLEGNWRGEPLGLL